MDTQIERKKRFTPKQVYGGMGILFILVLILYFIFRDTTSSMTVDKSRITVATVLEEEFNDYIRVIGQVLPSRMIYLDAIEGGQVEERLHEEGAMVKKGDVILCLSNPLLNIGIMQSEADLAYQENELRNTRISMEQERLGLRQERIGVWKELVDEPTGNLDSTNGVEVMELLSNLNKQGTTIIIVTHSERDAAYAHRIIRLLDGKIIAENRNRHQESHIKTEVL